MKFDRKGGERLKLYCNFGILVIIAGLAATLLAGCGGGGEGGGTGGKSSGVAPPPPGYQAVPTAPPTYNASGQSKPGNSGAK